MQFLPEYITKRGVRLKESTVGRNLGKFEEEAGNSSFYFLIYIIVKFLHCSLRNHISFL